MRFRPSYVMTLALLILLEMSSTAARAAIVEYKFFGNIAACGAAQFLCVPETRIEGRFGYSTERTALASNIFDPVAAGEYFEFTIISELTNGAPFSISARSSDYSLFFSSAFITPVDLPRPDRFTFFIQTSDVGRAFDLQLALQSDYGTESVAAAPPSLTLLAVPNPGVLDITLPRDSFFNDEHYTFNQIRLASVPVPSALYLLLGGIVAGGCRCRRGSSTKIDEKN